MAGFVTGANSVGDKDVVLKMPLLQSQKLHGMSLMLWVQTGGENGAILRFIGQEKQANLMAGKVEVIFSHLEQKANLPLRCL